MSLSDPVSCPIVRIVGRIAGSHLVDLPIGDHIVHPGDHPAAGALRLGGRVVFTLEDAGPETGPGFRLAPHGRYSHTKGYLHRCLAEAGLALRALEDDVLRKEGGKPVAGLLVLAEK